MHFELLITGKIPTGKGNKHLDRRTEIRLQVHRQMLAVWEANPLKERREKLAKVPPIPYSAVVRRWDKWFVAPVSEALATACKLDVVFYEPTGSLEVTSSVADPDNRIAGLLDLLSIPTNETAAATLPEPAYTLLADDKLVWALGVERRRLLRPVEGAEMFTRVAVRVLPTAATTSNPALIDIPVH